MGRTMGCATILLAISSTSGALRILAQLMVLAKTDNLIKKTIREGKDLLDTQLGPGSLTRTPRLACPNANGYGENIYNTTSCISNALPWGAQWVAGPSFSP